MSPEISSIVESALVGDTVGGSCRRLLTVVIRLPRSAWDAMRDSGRRVIGRMRGMVSCLGGGLVGVIL